MEIDPKVEVAILRVLRDTQYPLGGDAIAKEIQAYGLDVSGRTVRLYLHEMERAGLVSHAGRGRAGGRTITSQGAEEIQKARILDRVGLTAARVESLAYEMDFDLASRKGRIVLNVTTVDESHLERALSEMVVVYDAGLGTGEYVALAHAGERLGDTLIPPGQVGIGTVCSVTLNGVLLKAGIPTVSRFGGVLEIQDGQPVRFTDVIYYEGTSLDPLEIFLRAGLKSVREAARTGSGRIGVSFREVPTAAVSEVERIRREMQRAGLSSIRVLGKPNQPLVDFPVHEGRTGMLVKAGLNPAAAVQESGIPTHNIALSNLFEFEKMVHYRELVNGISGGTR